VSLYLTADELHDLTGQRWKSKQIEWLRAKRWRFEVTAEGFPRVARAYWQRRMVDDAPLEEPARLPKRPNFAILKGAA
jgi:hypothetical protein